MFTRKSKLILSGRETNDRYKVRILDPYFDLIQTYSKQLHSLKSPSLPRPWKIAPLHFRHRTTLKTCSIAHAPASPTNSIYKGQQQSHMGVFTSLQTYIKEKRSKRKAAKSQKSQSQSLQQDAQQGLWDEHLASVPPPQQVREAEKKQVEKQEGIGQAGGEAAVQREVRVEAPVPLAA